MALEEKLQLIRVIQLKGKYLAVGGSLGLYLQGITLGRGYDESDIDLVTSSGSPYTNLKVVEKEENTDSTDYQYLITDYDIKVELAIDDNTPTKTIEHNGYRYAVVDKYFIISRKAFYASKGNTKQIEDMNYLMKQL